MYIIVGLETPSMWSKLVPPTCEKTFEFFIWGVSMFFSISKGKLRRTNSFFAIFGHICCTRSDGQMTINGQILPFMCNWHKWNKWWFSHSHDLGLFSLYWGTICFEYCQRLGGLKRGFPSLSKEQFLERGFEASFSAIPIYAKNNKIPGWHLSDSI